MREDGEDWRLRAGTCVLSDGYARPHVASHNRCAHTDVRERKRGRGSSHHRLPLPTSEPVGRPVGRIGSRRRRPDSSKGREADRGTLHGLVPPGSADRSGGGGGGNRQMRSRTVVSAAALVVASHARYGRVRADTCSRIAAVVGPKCFGRRLLLFLYTHPAAAAATPRRRRRVSLSTRRRVCDRKCFRQQK